MDAELLIKVAGMGLSLLAGGVSKNRLKLNHKAAGPTQNMVLGQGITGLGNLVPGVEMTVMDGVQVAAGTELLYQGGKSVYHAARSLGGLLGKVLGRR